MDAFYMDWNYPGDEIFNNLLRITQIYYNIGFRVFIVYINSWRLGYDYHVYEWDEYLKPENKPKYNPTYFMNKCNFVVLFIKYFL